MFYRMVVLAFCVIVLVVGVKMMQNMTQQAIDQQQHVEVLSTRDLPKTIVVASQGDTHCLDPDILIHKAFVDDLQSRTKDMIVYDENSTAIGPLAADGTRTIKMTYGIMDGMGKVRRGRAIGTIKDADCSYSITSFGR
jgi:hypothetical protein